MDPAVEILDDPAIELPDDVLAEIFSRLDFPDKLRCKAVSKDWRRILSTTRGLWGSLELEVAFSYRMERPVVSFRWQRINVGDYTKYHPVPEPISYFASWLARLLRTGSLTDVRLSMDCKVITEEQAASLTSLALELATADAEAPAPVLQVSIDPVIGSRSAQTAARLINAIDEYPARCTALRIDLESIGASDVPELKVCIASLPRHINLRLENINWPNVNFDAAIIELLGSFHSIILETEQFVLLAEPLDLSTLPPPRIQNLQLRVMANPNNLGEYNYFKVLRYFSSSLKSIKLKLGLIKNEGFHVSDLQKYYPGMLKSLFLSVPFPNLKNLSIILSFSNLLSARDPYEMLALRYKRSSSSSFEPQPGNAGPIRPDAPMSEFLAALPPSLEGVRILDDRLSLYRAAFDQDAARIKDLLSRGANVNATNRYGETALMDAISHRYRKPGSSIVRLLLENGADPTIYNTRNMNALQHACECGVLHVVQELLRDPRVNPRERHSEGKSALGYAKESLERLRLQDKHAQKSSDPGKYTTLISNAEAIIAALRQAMGADTAEVVVGLG